MGGDVESRNEEGLGQSRSLTRCANADARRAPSAPVSRALTHPRPFAYTLPCCGVRCRPQNKAKVSSFTYVPEQPFLEFLE